MVSVFWTRIPFEFFILFEINQPGFHFLFVSCFSYTVLPDATGLSTKDVGEYSDSQNRFADSGSFTGDKLTKVNIKHTDRKLLLYPIWFFGKPEGKRCFYFNEFQNFQKDLPDGISSTDMEFDVCSVENVV